MNVGAILLLFFAFVKGFFEKVHRARWNVRPAKTNSGCRLKQLAGKWEFGGESPLTSRDKRGLFSFPA